MKDTRRRELLLFSQTNFITIVIVEMKDTRRRELLRFGEAAA